jgi:predicted dinucleotide-binding enzyme
MHIAILGAGNVGGALGKGWSRAGHSIAYGVLGVCAHAADAAHRAEWDRPFLRL